MAPAPLAGAVCTTSELVDSLKSLATEDFYSYMSALLDKNRPCGHCMGNCVNLILAKARSLSCLDVECGGGSLQCAAKCVLAADYKSCAMACPGGGSGPSPLMPLARLPSHPSPVSPHTPRPSPLTPLARLPSGATRLHDEWGPSS
jgi:hypothetical protein